jgi:NhaA family Na+:H+ antiporter
MLSWLRQPEKLSGLLTMIAIVAALALANSPLRGLYELVHHTPVALRVGELQVEKPLVLWINEGLMVFFFLLVALELKREALEGHLASPAHVALPAFAAAGGMLAPAAIYLAFAWGDAAASRGWAIPTATDTVLALAALHAMGARVPASVKTFLTALAIFDDLGAIIILAVLYTKNLSFLSLFFAAAAILALAVINRLGVTRTSAYVVLGFALWVAVLESGVHATLAGVLIGLAVPLRVKGRAGSPLVAAERGLRPWVALGVVPLFAYFNSGLRLPALGADELSYVVALGAAAGLALGKQAGILGAAWLAVRLGMARLPAGASWMHIYGAALMAGIGFTMSLFFAGVAFANQPALSLSARVGVLAGSLVSAVLGAAFIMVAARPKATAE